jgi:hypothetical protein
VGHSSHPVALIIERIKKSLLYRLAVKLIRPCRELNSASFGVKARILSCSYDVLFVKEEMLQNFCFTRYNGIFFYLSAELNNIMFNFTYSECSKPVLNFEGYNCRVRRIFPTHPHIYRFIELLQEAHVYQQHKAEEPFLHMCKPRIISDKIDAQLARLLDQQTQGEISDLQLAISCGKAVKINLVKK